MGHRQLAVFFRSIADFLEISSYDKRGAHLSGREAKIMAAATRDWQTGDVIAQVCKEDRSGAFSALLTNLADRGLLESGRSGYRLPTLIIGAEND